MSDNKKVKSVSFNIKNQEDAKILKMINVEDFNFSGYVKELITTDMQKREKLKIVHTKESGGIKIVIGR